MNLAKLVQGQEFRIRVVIVLSFVLPVFAELPTEDPPCDSLHPMLAEVITTALKRMNTDLGLWISPCSSTFYPIISTFNF